MLLFKNIWFSQNFTNYEIVNIATGAEYLKFISRHFLTKHKLSKIACIDLYNNCVFDEQNIYSSQKKN